ncbi:S-layer homology domain-containing protein [Cohnella abietis]|uniref:beta-galactosidase n=1 Tax=Cohnella abietis TaxID=2507935 RepID=A0A3T1D0Q7_9BACL|nr:S-layer homology domain-containing protein [Cohnella abietis]BBI31589.1 hypothetical protein KCTCHS21_09880 [Cohnella abietis]
MVKRLLVICLIVSVFFSGFSTFPGLTAGVAAAEELTDHDIPDWGFGGSAQADYTLDKSTVHEGSYSLRLYNRTPVTPNVFYNAFQEVQVKPNTTYELSVWVKADNASTVWFGGGPGWNLRKYVADNQDTYNWKKETISYTTGSAETTFTFRIGLENITDHIWFDDISMVEAGTTENLIQNGGFEKKRLPDVTSNQQAGEVLVGTEVQLHSRIAGTEIYYTTDGSDPRTSATKLVYAQPISITKTMTIKAYATKIDSLDSHVSSFQYVIGTGITGESILDLELYKNKLGEGRKAPILKANNIQVDGNPDEWSSYTGIKLPSNIQKQVVLPGWGGESDLSANAKFAYDDNFFYMTVKVKDNVHYSVPNEAMWVGDSVQIAFSQDGVYGPEYAFSLYEGQPQIWRYASGSATMDKSSVTYQVKRINDETIYEAKLPWLAIFDTKPSVGDSIPFTMLVNDNDGDGRRGWIEWTSAIGRGKNPNEMAELQLVSEEDKWIVSIEGNRGFAADDENPFAIYVPNFSNQPLQVKVNSDFFHLVNQDVVIPAQSVWKKDISLSVPMRGDYTADVSVLDETSGISKRDALQLRVSSNPNELLNRLTVLEQKLPALESLLSSAEAQQIPIDYEKVNVTVIKNFIQYGKEDIENAYLDRAYYYANELDKLYNEAESNLQAYLQGTKTPLQAPRYVNGSVEIQGNSFIADTMITGSNEVVRRPVFFNGYLGFGQVRKDITQFADYGTNAIQMEIGPNSVIKLKDSFSDWNIYLSGGVQASAVLDRTVSHSGQASVRMNRQSPISPNVFMNISQTVAVKPNTHYEMKAWVKGEAVTNTWFMGGPGWVLRKSFPEGTYDWTEVTYSYTTGANETEFTFIILTDDAIGNAWFDDISMTEQGSVDNLLINGDFEHNSFVDLNNEHYLGDTSTIKNDVVKTLQKAADNNIAVNLLLSPHYMPSWALEKWPEMKSESAGFIKYNISNPNARAIIEDYLRVLIPLIKDYPSLQSITLSNESVYQSYRDEYNLPAWQEYLQENYTDIQQLNNTYHTSYVSFANVPLPASPAHTPFFYDWVKFNNKLFSEWHKWMADIIHEIAPNIPLQAKVMNGALNDIGNLTWGVDPEQFAEFSQINGNDNANYYGDGPAGFSNELKFYDLQASLKKAPVFNSETHVIMDGAEQYIPVIASHVKSVLWQGAIHGRGGSTIWVWERTYDTNSDFKGSILHRPDVVAGVGKVSLDMNRLAEEITAFQDDEAKAAILYAMPAMIYDRPYPEAINQVYDAISYSGLKVGFVSEKQAHEGGLAGIKVLFVPEVSHMNAETLVSIQQFVERGGKLVVTGSNSLKFDEHDRALSGSIRNQVMNSSNTTLIASNTLAKQIRETVTPLFAEVGLNEVVLIDAATNLPVYDTEWRSVWQNGRLLINIDNYSSVVKSVYVQVNGQRIGNWKDLISSTTAIAENTLLLSPLETHLLSVEPTGITLDSESYTIKVGETHDTVVHAVFESGVNQPVTTASSYVSSHPNIATVDINGKVTAVAKGTAQITVTYHGKQAIISVNSVSDDTTETPNPPINNIGGSNKDNITKVTLENGKAVAKLEKNQTTATVPLTEIGDHPFQVQAGAVMVNIDQVQLNALRNQGGNEAGATIEVQLKPVIETGGMSASSQGTAQIKLAGQVYEISVRLIKANGSTIEVKQITGSVEITLPYDANGVDSELLGIYYYNETTKQWEYVGGQLNSSAKTMTVKLQHLSKYAVLQYSKTFSDVPATHWAARTLQILAAKHIVNGVSDSLFQPAGETTRAEFVALLVRALNLEAAEDVKAFKDVKSDAWYAGSVQAAVKAGIVTGVSVDRFAPNAPISRAEMVVLIARALGLKDDASVKVDFADSKDIPLWAISSVAELKQMGLIQGNGHNRFNPQANATRAEAAKLILGTINQLK